MQSLHTRWAGLLFVKVVYGMAATLFLNLQQLHVAYYQRMRLINRDQTTIHTNDRTRIFTIGQCTQKYHLHRLLHVFEGRGRGE